VSWARGSAPSRRPCAGDLRFAFYGRVSTGDWQDPASSLVRQREQAEALVRGHGTIVAEFFDIGECRSVWARRPQAAALVTQLADSDRRWGAVVIGEYERAFYGNQYGLMAPLFEHYGVQLWLPEAGGRDDFACEHDERAMTVLGLSSKREVTRTSIRVRTAMAVQARDQGRYLGGRPPYGYQLADAGPHPNKMHAAWGRRAHRLEPHPRTEHIVRWIFAQRLASHSVARIARALNDTRIPCPSAADPARNPHRAGNGWTVRSVGSILSNPRYTGRQVWNGQPTDLQLADPADISLGHRAVQRWNLPDGWVISARPAHPPLVSEADFITAQDIRTACSPVPRDSRSARRYVLAGLLTCGTCGRRMEQVWSNGKAAYRCRHGHTSASALDPGRPKHAYLREDQALEHLPALHLLLTQAEPSTLRRRRTRRGVDVRSALNPLDTVQFFRETQIALVYDQGTGTLQADKSETAKPSSGKPASQDERPRKEGEKTSRHWAPQQQAPG
jgi:site-specific DNA recombinase